MAKQKKTVIADPPVGLIADQILNGADKSDVPTSAEVSQNILFMDPAMITLTDNTRFKLKPGRVTQLANNIREIGKVLEPVGVEEMVGGGFELIYGKYRHAAVAQLNKDGFDIQLPTFVYSGLTPAERLKMQVSENIERESLSLVDKALSMQALLDQGMSKVEVRNIFGSAGGRKGNAWQPMSNVYLNDHLFILTLSRTLQDKIDEGVLPISSVKALINKEPAMRESIVKAAEVARDAQIKKDEAEEERFIKRANVSMEAQEKAEADVKRLADLKQTGSDLFTLGKTLDKAIKDVNLKHNLKATKAESELWMKEMKEATEAKLLNDKAYKKASSDYVKLKAKLDAAKEPKEAAAPKPNGKTSIGPAAIEKAAKEVGGVAVTVRLKMTELIAELGEMRKLGHDSPAFLNVIGVFSKLIEGELTTKEAAAGLAAIIEVVLPVGKRVGKK